ncbi:MAG: flavin reductase [Desulfobacterales bacterium]|nr:MAG: flavin reductase [Desulfobacterales bacterium]
MVKSIRRILKTDKSGVFEIFHGELKNAPMIKACPLNMECKPYDTYDTPTHDLFIGEIVETYAEEAVLTDGKVDITKVKPLLFDSYCSLVDSDACFRYTQ